MDKFIDLKACFSLIFKIPALLQIPIDSIHVKHTGSFKTVSMLWNMLFTSFLLYKLHENMTLAS